jgi:hypothetical protein
LYHIKPISAIIQITKASKATAIAIQAGTDKLVLATLLVQKLYEMEEGGKMGKEEFELLIVVDVLIANIVVIIALVVVVAVVMVVVV